MDIYATLTTLLIQTDAMDVDNRVVFVRGITKNSIVLILRCALSIPQVVFNAKHIDKLYTLHFRTIHL